VRLDALDGCRYLAPKNVISVNVDQMYAQRR